MDILLSIKRCLQSLGSKTKAQVTANTGLMIVKGDGNDAGEPLGYITREVLLQMIRDELPSVLSNLNGSVNQVLGKTDNGGIGYETVQSLASVLGGLYESAINSIVAGQTVTIPLHDDSMSGILLCHNSARGAGAVFLVSGSNITLISGGSSFFFTAAYSADGYVFTCTDTNTSRYNSLRYKWLI